jgi:hypothetical protein
MFGRRKADVELMLVIGLVSSTYLILFYIIYTISE